MSEIKIAYCLRCRKKVEVQNPEEIITKNNRKALKGLCPICSTRLFKFLPSVKKEENKEVEKEMEGFDESK